MADENKTIRYVVEFDTTSGKAQMRDFLEDQDGARTPAPKPKKEEDEAFDIAQSISRRLKAAAIGGLAFADTPGQAMGATGALVGGVPGAVIAGFGVLADKLTDTVRGLAQFDGGLFASTTELDFFMMGWKIELARGISDAFAKLLPSLERLMADALPLVIDGFHLLATVTKPVIDVFSFTLRESKELLDKVNQGWGHLIDLMVQMPDSDRGRTFTEYLALAAGSMSDLANSSEDLNRLNEMMLQGHAISMAMMGALDDFAGGAGHGSQGLGGTRFEQAPPVGIAVGLAGRGGVAGLHGRTAQDGPSAFPRPEGAAVNFKVTDAINVQAGDEQQMLMELSNLRSEVMQAVYGMIDQRWMSLQHARAQVAAGFGG